MKINNSWKELYTVSHLCSNMKYKVCSHSQIMLNVVLKSHIRHSYTVFRLVNDFQFDVSHVLVYRYKHRYIYNVVRSCLLFLLKIIRILFPILAQDIAWNDFKLQVFMTIRLNCVVFREKYPERRVVS